MIVGEAPNSHDDQANRPFQGNLGTMLLGLLADAQIDHADIYVTNVVKCRSSDMSPPSAKEMKTCMPYLEDEIATVKPEMIVTLGSIALKALTRKAKITELHGQVLDYKGIPLMPTFHPAIALRDPAKMPALKKDFIKLGHIVRGTTPSVDDIHWKVIKTDKTWNHFLDLYLETEEVSVDIETNGLDRMAPNAMINSIQFGLEETNWCLPLGEHSPWDYEDQRDMLEALTETSKGKVIIGQNFKFDNLWLMQHYGVKFYLRFDTMLASHTLDENRPHGLKELASTLLSAPNYDVDLKTKKGAGDLKKMYRYGCYDVHYTRQLYQLFRQQLLKDPSLRRLFYQLVMPAARMFETVEESGMMMDKDKLKDSEKELTAKLNTLESQLNKSVGKVINWNSPAQIGKILFSKGEGLGLPVLEATKGGAPSTSESVLLRLADQHEVAKKLVEYRSVKKNLSTYILGWQELMHGDRLYLSTKLHGTVTGRYASRLHQVPRDPFIRSHFIAPDGYVLVVADYSQIELRLAAMISNDQRMKQIFQTNGDIHKMTASFLLGKPEDQLTKEERKMAKAVNFGLLYGMGAPKLVLYARDNYGVDMKLTEAQKFRKRYFELYSALPPWHERQRRCVRAFSQVVSLSGRVRRLPGVHSSDKGVRAEAERQGINSPVQGFGSGDLKAMAMVEISETYPLDQVQIKGEVHDSILMYIRESMVDDLLPELKAIMESPKRLKKFEIRMTVPLVVDFEIGPWGIGKAYEF